MPANPGKALELIHPTSWLLAFAVTFEHDLVLLLVRSYSSLSNSLIVIDLWQINSQFSLVSAPRNNTLSSTNRFEIFVPGKKLPSNLIIDKIYVIKGCFYDFLYLNGDKSSKSSWLGKVIVHICLFDYPGFRTESELASSTLCCCRSTCLYLALLLLLLLIWPLYRNFTQIFMNSAWISLNTNYFNLKYPLIRLSNID